MHVIFINVNSKFHYMFTVGKEYPITATHNIYGVKVLTDNEKECWVHPLRSEYGGKEIIDIK